MKKPVYTVMGNKTGVILFLLMPLATLLLNNVIYASYPEWTKSTVNGNFYTLTPSMTWTDCEAWAKEWGGHLVTLRSWSEESWIKESFGSDQYFWIGFNVIGREHSEENFYWSSGESVTYTNWAPYEPSNSGGVESVTAMNDAPHLPAQFGDYWNDMANDNYHRGVAEIVTYDELGLVLESSGEVSITRSDPQTKQGDTIRKGDLLRTADLIKTYTNSMMMAAFPAEQGSRIIDIQSESEIKIAKGSSPSGITIDFFKGEIKSKIKDLPEDYFYEVITPHTYGAVRGTEFIVEGNESYTKITVLEGSVEVTTLDGTQSVMVQEDYAVQATDDGLGEPYPVESEPEYFAGGSGTETEPWLIETAIHLDNLRNFLGQEHEDKHFKQIADINLGESPWNEGEGWTPIGSSENPFYSNYDGNGHKIMNMFINRHTSAYQGLFGWNNGNITNLGVVDAFVTDHGSRAGILAGINDSGLITNCFTTGTIQCQHNDGRIGGLTGWNNSSIEYSHSTAYLYTTGILAGGLTGVNHGGSIINSYATGDVHSDSIYAGGLVGYNWSGGLISACYATGSVSGLEWTGGLVGQADHSHIINSYSTGYVESKSKGNAGGLIGINIETTILNSFWNIGTSGQTESAGGEGKNSNEMTSRATFTGWDFDTNWHIIEGNTYPYLQWQETPEEYNYPLIIYITISVVAGENGSISPSDEVKVEYGDDQVFTIESDEGFHLAYIKIDGSEIDLETDENWDAESGQYTFSNVTKAHTIEVGFESATGINDVAVQNELKVYPNPAKNELLIEFNYRGSDKPVILMQNMQGQVVKQIPVKTNGLLLKRLPINDLTSGVYLLTIRGEKVFPVKKVIIEN